MRIKEIVFNGNFIFKDHIINFGNPAIPMISFLVGNNGSGKTRVLDTIYQFLGNSDPIHLNHGTFVGSTVFNIELNNEETSQVGISNILYEVKKTNSDITRQFSDAKTGMKVVYQPPINWTNSEKQFDCFVSNQSQR